MRRVLYTLILLGLLIAARPWRGFVRHSDVEEGTPVIEVAIFEAGFGAEWHREVVESFKADRAAQGKPVHVEFWADPRVEDKLRPRILAGQPPSFAQAYLPFWTLVLTDQLIPFDAILDRPLPGDPDRRFRDTFVPGSLALSTHQGKTYALPVAYNAWVFWYSKKLFREHNWSVPNTWAELIELCEAMQAIDLDPIAFQGKYAAYSNVYVWHLIQSCAGMERLQRIQTLDADAFEHPDVVKAARLFQELAMRHFLQSSLSMSHIESQTQFCLGETGLVACGLFFENEMKNVLPADFELGAFPFPPVEGGLGDPLAVYGGPIEMFFCFKKGQNPEVAVELATHLLSVENMTDFASRFNTLSPITEANARATFSPAMSEIRDILANRPVRFKDGLQSYAQTWDVQYRRPLTDQLIRGTITPEHFVSELARGMRIARDDPDVLKPDLSLSQ